MFRKILNEKNEKKRNWRILRRKKGAIASDINLNIYSKNNWPKRKRLTQTLNTSFILKQLKYILHKQKFVSFYLRKLFETLKIESTFLEQNKLERIIVLQLLCQCGWTKNKDIYKMKMLNSNYSNKTKGKLNINKTFTSSPFACYKFFKKSIKLLSWFRSLFVLCNHSSEHLSWNKRSLEKDF